MSHPKGVLLERAQKLGLARPEFRTARTGPEHEPVFITDVVLDGEVIGTGQGGTKRTAEKHAAEEALVTLDARQNGAAKSKPAAKAKGTERPAERPAAEPEKRVDDGPAARTAPEPQVSPATAAQAAAADEPFDGPWPMFDDLLAAVVKVAERRVFADLRGEEARVAIREFSLSLYKELLLGLGDIVEDEED